MKRFFAALALGVTAVLGAGLPASAQAINNQQSADLYAQVRGWSVYAMADGRGYFGCRAVIGSGYNGELMIDYSDSAMGPYWSVYVRANRTPADQGFGLRGAALYFDGKLFSDAQIGFGVLEEDGASHTHAMLNLNDASLTRFRAAGTMRLSINGEADRTYSLKGSTAASLKVQECAQNHGVPVAAAAAPSAPAAQPAAQPAARAPLDGFNVGYVRFGNGQYRDIGNGNWVEEGDNGSMFFFTRYDATAESVFLTDDARNVQIWIDISRGEISYTQNRDNNTWELIYRVECAASSEVRSC